GRPQGNYARPYYGYLTHQITPAPQYHQSWFLGAGGVYSTAQDLSKWLDIIQRDDFLNAGLRQDLFSKHTKAGDSFYGYGWQIEPSGTIKHDGGNAGFMSHISFDPTTNRKVIILTNRSFSDIRQFGKSAQKISNLSNAVWQSLEGKKVDILPMPYNDIEICTGTFRFEDDLLIHIYRSDSTFRVKTNDHTPTRIVANTPLPGKNFKERELIAIADLLNKKKFWKLAKYCDGEMSFVAYSGLLSYGFKTMTDKIGKLITIIPYKVEDTHGIMRMKGTEGNLDIIAYFNEDGEIQGLFEHGFYLNDDVTEMIAYGQSENTLFVNGFPYGEKDCRLIFENDVVYLEQHGRSLKAQLQK
ncbi:hypothetical protein E1176_16295, partial [Fulvivirga sp. RKSG066]|uniref:serine hydrolase n=1 Tax=Fulvivirga aurantia TaxID=2529383 RepID=UPI0012BC4A59